MKKNNTFRRAAALVAALSITVSLAAPAFAGTYYIDDGDITVTKDEDGKQTVQYSKEDGTTATENDSGEIIITTSNADKTTLESDLEGPAAEDSGFGPVVEDNYQPEDDDQKKSTEEPKDADQQEDAEEPKDADRQESAEEQESAGQQPQQAAPAAAPAAPTSVNPKDNGFWGNTITVINNFANTVLNLTLKDVKIDVSDEDEKTALSVQGDGNVEIELDGDNELKSGFVRAGLEKNTSEGTLTLKDDNKDGSLKATGGANGAGIGGSMNNGTNKITIKGGTVEAKGGLYAAGIGGGGVGSGGGSGKDITITGGRVTAIGGTYAAGIGGGSGGSGKNITINGGTVTAAGGFNGAGIGGGIIGSGENITITGGEVEAKGGENAAGIGGGGDSGGSNVTVSGAAQVTATAGKGSRYAGAGATIGGGGSSTVDSDSNPVPIPGTEIQADISGLTTGYIHHIICNQDSSIKREWREPERPQPKPENPQPTPDGPNAPAEESNEVDLGTPGLHVETLEGVLLPFDARQHGGTLRVTSNTLAARLHGTRQALEALREQGVEQIQFVTSFKTTTLSVEDLLAEGGSWFALEHDGLVSRQLSAAQAESLKCWMH